LGVTIREFELLTLNGAALKKNEDGTIDLRVRVVCSAGTYVRTLAEDLGEKLSIGAHLVELHRTRAGQFQIDAALTLERLAESFTQNVLVNVLISPHHALSQLPAIDLDDDQLGRTLRGLDLPVNDSDPQLRDKDPVRLSRNNQLIAIGKYHAEQRTIHPEVVLGPP
jgi:tRNA pseudouridine55 synthase